MKDWCDRGQGLQSTERGSAILMRLTCAAFETGETRRGDPLNKRATHRNRRPVGSYASMGLIPRPQRDTYPRYLLTFRDSRRCLGSGPGAMHDPRTGRKTALRRVVGLGMRAGVSRVRR